VNGAVRLGRFAGVDVVADASTFLLGLLFGGVVFVYIGQTVPNASAEIGGLFAALAGVAVIGCVFLHEASHVVVALRRGLAVRSIRLYVFGGYSVIDGAPTPRTELLVSIAGPASSVLSVGARTGKPGDRCLQPVARVPAGRGSDREEHPEPRGSGSDRGHTDCHDDRPCHRLCDDGCRCVSAPSEADNRSFLALCRMVPGHDSRVGRKT